MTQREQKNILEHQGPSKPLKKSWELLFGSFANSDPIATQNQDEDVIIISDDDDDNDDTMDDTMDNECEIALENPTETPPSPDTTDSNMETSNTDVESNYTDALNDMDSSSGDIEFYDCVMELNNNNVEVADKNSNNSRDFEISEDTTGTTDDYIEISDDEEDTIVNQNNEGDDDSCVFLYENITQQRLSHIQEDDVVDITEKMKIVSKAKAKELDRLRRSLNVIETSHHKKVAHTRDRYNRISKYNFQSYDMSRVCGSEVYKAYMRVKEYNSSLEKDVLTIHTAFVDGSLRFKKFGNMGRCFGGLGVYWGNNDPRNLSEPCGAEIVSSDGAELMAILRALQVCGDPTSSLRIESDSMHSILAIRGRFTIIDPVIRDILKRIKFQLNLRQAKVYFAKVPAHNGIPGNEAADKLAKIGSTTCMRRFEREYYKNSYKNPYDIPYKSPYKSPYKNFYPLR